MKRLFAIALLFAGLAARAQETPTVTARVEPDSIMIGDRFDYVIDVEKDLVQVVEFPVFDPRDGKIELVEQANRAGTPIISCMGAGNKLNAAAFEVSDIYNAVLDGASSLMLTGETAVGQYPVQAMEYLVRTARTAM